MKVFKKFLALGLATTLIVAPMTAYAAESGSLTGDSHLEGALPDDVIAVVLPTTIDKVTYNFTLDPADLLSKYDATDKSKYDGSSVYFANAVSGGTAYTSTSDIGTAINKSTCNVVLDVNVTVTNVATNAVTFTEKTAVESDEKTNVYIGLVPTNKGVVVGNGSTITAEAPVPTQAKAINSSGKTSASFLLAGTTTNFDIKQTVDASVISGHKYTYIAKDTATWTTAGFALEGACNTKADWKAFNEKSKLLPASGGENLKIAVIYTMDPVTSNQAAQIKADGTIVDSTTGLVAFATGLPSLSKSTISLRPGNLVNVFYSLGKGSLAAKNLMKIEIPKYNYTLRPGIDYENKRGINVSGGEHIQFAALGESIFNSSGVTGTYILNVIFDDAANTTVQLTVEFMNP